MNKHDDWYDRIEEPVREVVRRLRNAGINTTCSCGHDMYIECDTTLDGEIMDIHNVLWHYFEETGQKVTFDVTYRHKVVDGAIRSTMTYIELPKDGRASPKKALGTDEPWLPTHFLTKDFDDGGFKSGHYASVQGNRVAFVNQDGEVLPCVPKRGGVHAGAPAIYVYTAELKDCLRRICTGAKP